MILIKKNHLYSLAAIVMAVTFFAMGIPVFASSHREAPLISGDPKVDATDLYAFVSKDDPTMVTLIANYSPFENPAGGPNFDSFDDNALYDINIDNDGDGKADIVYEFKFNTTVANPNTFLYNTGPIKSDTDANWNAKQTYSLTRIENGVRTDLGDNITMPPVNIGPKSTPDYGSLQSMAIHPIANNGGKVFAGQIDDPFFVDLGSLFDLLTIRVLPGNAGGGVNSTKGFNVHSLSLQIPISKLTVNKNVPTDVKDPNSVIGVWTTASRQTTRVLTNGKASTSGDWVQVSRLGSPLVNEVVIPRGQKDTFNGSMPQDDAQFANAVANPEVGTLLKALYNIAVPPQGNFGTASQRDDLEAIFLTGIPGLTKSVKAAPAEELRLNVAVPPSANPNRMGVLAGDNAGYPNGRRLGDDVVDISLQAVAGAAYPLFHAGFTVDPTGAKLGDGVNANDLPFRSTFPYTALPHQGFDSLPLSSLSMGGSVSSGTSNTNGNTMPGMSSSCMISTNLTLASTGADVDCLQTYLIAQGYLNVPSPTHYFGVATQSAVMKWQSAAGISATGYFGSLSRSAFNNR